MLWYILIARTKIVEEIVGASDTREYWKNWLEQKEEDRKLGRCVCIGIRNVVTRIRQQNES